MYKSNILEHYSFFIYIVIATNWTNVHVINISNFRSTCLES